MSSFTNQQAAPMHAADALADIENALESLKRNKPDERSELARIYAVTITQAEQAFAYFKVYAVDVLVAKAMKTSEDQKQQIDDDRP